jgi:hypothetical protein
LIVAMAGVVDRVEAIERCAPQETRKPVKLQKQSDGRIAIIFLIGRIRSEDLDELRDQMSDGPERVVLDLGDVTLVDADVIRFLGCSEQEGIRLVRCPRYVREWIRRECAGGKGR